MQQSISIGTKRQLIDLNQEKVDFDLTVTVQAANPDSAFKAVVITQQELDEGSTIAYRDFVGSMSARITNDKGIYENHFLCLKSEAPVDAVVTVQFYDMPETRIQDVSEYPTSEEIDQGDARYQSATAIVQPSQQLSTFNGLKSYATMKNGMIAIAIAAIIVGIYLLWSKNPSSEGALTASDLVKGLTRERSEPPIVSALPTVTEAAETIRSVAQVPSTALPRKAPDLTTVPSPMKPVLETPQILPSSNAAVPGYDRVLAKLQELVPDTQVATAAQ